MSKVKFEDVATRVNTREDKDNTSLLYYVGGDHIESGELVVRNRGLIEGSTIGPMFYFGFKKGDILLVSRNPHLRKAAMVDFDGICSEKTFVIGTKDEKVLLQKYLAVIVQSDSFWNYCEEHKSGGVNFFVNWSTLAKYEFDLPDIEEQRRISDKVWAAYGVKESYRRLIKATDEMVKSRFIEITKSERTQHHALNKLTSIERKNVNPIRGTIYTLYSFPAYDNNRIPEVIDGGDIKSSKLLLTSNTVLYNKLNVRLRRVWNIKEIKTNNNICSSEFIPLKVNKDVVLQEYLMYCLTSDTVTEMMESASQGTSNSQQRISPSSLMQVSIPVIPKNEQKHFIELYQQSDKSKFELKQAIEKIDKVMRALLQ